MRDLHPEEIEERRQRFNTLWHRRYVGLVSRLPAHFQGDVHEMLRSAFNAGSSWERRKSEPVQLGGMD